MAEVNDFLLELIKVLVLGVTQGFSDFLAVSANMRFTLMQNIIGADIAFINNPYVMLFLYLGTFFAIWFVFRRRIGEIVRAAGRVVVKIFTGRFVWKEARTNQKLVIFIILSYIPVLIFIPFISYIKSFENIFWLTGIFFIVSGAAYLFADRVKVNDRSDKKMKFKDAVVIGIANLFGIIPGVSGVGLTATFCSKRGFKKEFCAEYAFLLSVPFVIVNITSLLIEGINEKANLNEIPYGFFGMFAAFGMALIAIKVIKYLLKKKKMYIFAAISAVLGIAMIAYQFIF